MTSTPALPSWFKSPALGCDPRGVYTFEALAMMFATEATKTVHYVRFHNLVPKAEHAFEALSEKLGEKGFSLINDDSYCFLSEGLSEGSATTSMSFASKTDGVLVFQHGLFHLAASRPEVISTIRALLKEYFTAPLKTKQIGLIVPRGSGISYRMQTVGDAHPFVRENYSPCVAEAYDHVRKDLEAKDPCGRISIFMGLPGTGKTHIIRSLINDCDNAFFLLVPSMYVKDMSKPEFTELLMNIHDEAVACVPLVLILEDADESLIPRKNMADLAGISSLLNIGDGLVGSMLNIRIVATTNAKLQEMDPAIIRPGRLCRKVEIDRLPAAQAKARIMALSGASAETLSDTRYEDREKTLAEIYQEVRTLKDAAK